MLVASLCDSRTTRTIHLYWQSSQLRRPWNWRKKFERDLSRGQKEKDRHTGPHQCSGAFLVFQGRQTKRARRVEIRGIDHTFAKSEVSRKDVAGQSGSKEVEEDGPPWPNWNTGPGLDDWPPEEKTRREKRRVFKNVQALGLQGKVEHGRGVPAHKRSCGG